MAAVGGECMGESTIYNHPELRLISTSCARSSDSSLRPVAHSHIPPKSKLNQLPRF